MKKSRNVNIPATFLVLKKDNCILLARRCNTGYEDGNYGLVSGHVEAGESFSAALAREAHEEAGIRIFEKDIIQTHIQHRKSEADASERVDAYFLVERWQGKVVNMEPDKCSELAWFALDALPENMIGCVKKALSDMLDGKTYSEIGW